MCGDPKMLSDAMKSYPMTKDVNTKDCTLEGAKLFGSTKCRLNLLLGTNCDSHQPEKMNYSIPRPTTRAAHQHMRNRWILQSMV